ncbi:MAG: hypothetical protein VX007_04770, partial [Pseudomonadota bacterium]|nr:hypothetical protein [Pseudomonadota bacterium]
MIKLQHIAFLALMVLMIQSDAILQQIIMCSLAEIPALPALDKLKPPLGASNVSIKALKKPIGANT